MRYSIIIPTLNEAKLMPNLLLPLAEESLKEKYDYEIILSDGGSIDGTVEVARNFVDIVVTADGKENIAKGRNKGAAKAKGEILVFLNGDVEFNAEKLFEFIERNFRNSDYVGMTCSVNIHEKERTFADKLFMGFYNTYFHFLNIIGLGMGRGECQIVRKNLFDELGGYNENLAAGEDFEFFKRLRRKGKILFTHKIVICESPRRFRKYGHLKIFLTWTLNGLFVILKNKSLSKNWEEVR